MTEERMKTLIKDMGASGEEVGLQTAPESGEQAAGETVSRLAPANHAQSDAITQAANYIAQLTGNTSHSSCCRHAEAIFSYLRTTEPVSVSQSACAERLGKCFLDWAQKPERQPLNANEMVRAVLDAAGVKYE